MNAEGVGNDANQEAREIAAFAFSPDNRFIAYRIDDDSGNGIIVRELGAPVLKNLRFPYPSEYFDAIAFSPDSKYLAVYHADDSITLWSIAEPRSLGKDMGLVGDEGDNYLFHISDGRTLVVSLSGKAISVMEPGKGILFSATEIDAFSDYGQTIAISYSGHWLAAAANGKLHLFDLRTHSEQAVTADFGEVLAVAFDPCESVIAIGNKQGNVLLYGLAAGAIQNAPLKSHTAAISSLKFNINGTLLVSADVDGQVLLWDRTTSQLAVSPLSLAPPDTNGFTFSRTNALLAAGGTEGFTIWNTMDGSLVKSYGTVSTIGAPVIVSFAPEGNLLATSNFGGDGIEIWDGKGTERLGPKLSFSKGGSSFALDFSPNGKSLIAVQSDRIVRWDMDLDSWQARACKIANRNLTADEWQRYMGDRPYHATCPDLSLQH